jgi:hypothetical protein
VEGVHSIVSVCFMDEVIKELLNFEREKEIGEGDEEKE